MVLVLKTLRGHGEQLRLAWHCERPWKAIGEGTASVAVDGPGLKGSCKGFEAWYPEESL